VIDPNFLVRSYVDDFCVVPVRGDTKIGTPLETSSCDAAISADDGRHVWEVRKQGERRYF